MKNRYYQIRESSHPSQNGTIVRVSNGKLEVFAGETEEDELKNMICLNKGRLFANPKYSATEINYSKASELKQEFTHWIGLKLWIGGF